MKEATVTDNQNEGNATARIPDIISSLFEEMRPFFDCNIISWHELESDCPHSGSPIAGMSNVDKFEALSELFQRDPRALDLAKLHKLLKEFFLNAEISINEHAGNVVKCNARHDKIGIQPWFESREHSLQRLERDLNQLQNAKKTTTRWISKLQSMIPLQQIIRTSIKFTFDNPHLSEDRLNKVTADILEKKPFLLGDLLDADNPENSGIQNSNCQ